VPSSLPLAEAIRRADAAQARALVIVDHEDRPIAIVSEAAVMATPVQRRPWVDAGSLARTLDPGLVLSADLSGMALVDAVRRSPASEYLLVESSARCSVCLPPRTWTTRSPECSWDRLSASCQVRPRNPGGLRPCSPVMGPWPYSVGRDLSPRTVRPR